MNIPQGVLVPPKPQALLGSQAPKWFAGSCCKIRANIHQLWNGLHLREALPSTEDVQKMLQAVWGGFQCCRRLVRAFCLSRRMCETCTCYSRAQVDKGDVCALFWELSVCLSHLSRHSHEQGLFPYPLPVLQSPGASTPGLPLTSAGLATALCVPVPVCDSPLCLHICLMCLFSLVPITAVYKTGIILHNASFFWLLSCACLALHFPSKVTAGILSYLQCCSDSAEMKGLSPASLGADSEQGWVFLGILPYPAIETA